MFVGGGLTFFKSRVTSPNYHKSKLCNIIIIVIMLYLEPFCFDFYICNANEGSKYAEQCGVKNITRCLHANMKQEKHGKNTFKSG